MSACFYAAMGFTLASTTIFSGLLFLVSVAGHIFTSAHVAELRRGRQ